MGEVASEHLSVGAPESESTACAARLASFLRRIALAAAFLSASYVAVGLAVRAPGLCAASAAVAALSMALALASHRARRGHVDGPVEIASFGLLIAVVILTPMVAFAYATLTLTCAFAATVAIAFGAPQRSRPVILAAMVVALYAALLGSWLAPQRSAVPLWAQEALVVLTIILHVHFISEAMMQLRDRLGGTIRAQRAAASNLEETHRTLGDAYERARAADQRKDDFLAMLGHELRNPLSPITLALELMRDELGDIAARERAVIERQVKHMTRLVDDLLDASRITRGKLVLQREHIELATVVCEAIEMTRASFAERGQTLETDVPPSDLCLDADPTRLAQVLSNLLSNASKYTPAGGHVVLKARRTDGQVCLVVEDDGVGMTPELRARIFEPFVQGEGSAERRPGGLGLGLALARSLVEMHGGWITAESEGTGRGSRFTVVLPVVEKRASREPERPAKQRARGPRPRILVVDDNEDAAELLSLSLSRRGFDVRVAHDGAEALRVASEFAPEVAVLDIGLPGMDGYELAERIRAEADGHAPRLIAVTGFGQPRDRERSAEAGFVAHLVKPVKLEELERCMA
jgi:signal transduction histidine kinase